MRHRSLYRLLLETERPLPVAAVRDPRLGSLGIQFLAQFGAVVGLVTEHALGVLHSADKALRDRAIVRLTVSQEDGICRCVYLRVTFSLRTCCICGRAASQRRIHPPLRP